MQVIWQNIHNCATSMDLCPEAFFDEKLTEPLTNSPQKDRWEKV